ncbi:Xaa-Pro dipeptidase [Pseudobacteriovorax antillogorgiicola]|uniref:Xaa-Pro dipeptidase Metallo peptidase. MEROPS family M24B n=1 Tax=Pseudobacteriovorax antillogorgiicola TaxID=1513793 RepID=A0A1Y6BZ50_9BACT|nr:Xaa-Pro dipeptidase [Pseudobacteriovorax antillogorgiicola]TCS50247.1 Xaa-Pro dipeptidase [Pseudobacteriovorax antillogorgiicola]SMF32884.1 Xaa-Pro dipeptidase Metallo peptidase. MEROPS family M24B [Pseudobacteriovorax antillogorgiicola]
MQKLYNKHLSILQGKTEDILDELNLPGLVIDSGNAHAYFEDDQFAPFRPNHHFAHWCPLDSEHNVIVIRPGQKPALLAYIPEDFWHEHKPVSGFFWSDQFEISEFGDVQEIWQTLSESYSGFAYHGPQAEKAANADLQVNVEGLLPRLDWNRSFKTDYEVFCLEEATKLAVKGHLAAKSAFDIGESELGIHHAYQVSSRTRDHDLPYEAIVCLNEKSAFLHYHDKRDDIRDGDVLLIDAGCQFNGYASDITRTHVSENAHPVFKELLKDMEAMQVSLTKMPKVGMTMADLHWESHIGLAKILIDHEILLDIEAEEAVTQGLTGDFYPHGIGHMLGLLVHDVAGRQVNPEGEEGEPDPRFPKLRSLRRFEVGHYFTIEPGLYFIDMLLKKRKGTDFEEHFNWDLIEELKPFGGIRIEDNILITKKGPRNITREFLAI